MALTATFDPVESRVRLQVSGESPATWATFWNRPAGATTWQVVRGGYQVALSSGSSPAVFDYEFQAAHPPAQTVEYRATLSNSVTRTATVGVDITDQAWLKFPGFPYLNRRLTITGRSPIGRGGRGALLPVVSSRTPVAVQEFMSSREFSVTVKTETYDQFTDLDAALSIGGILFLHADEARLGIPCMYVVASQIDVTWGGSQFSARRYTTIAFREVGKPSYMYFGTLSTWQTVVNTYASWSALLAARADWNEVLEIEGSPADVVVA